MITVTTELSDNQAMALAQFVKRVGWSEMRGCAVDDEEAYEIRAALEQLRRSLVEAGLSPR
jgi:hypothetical protein